MHIPDVESEEFAKVMRSKDAAAAKVLDAQLKVDETRLRAVENATVWATMKAEFEALKAALPKPPSPPK